MVPRCMKAFTRNLNHRRRPQGGDWDQRPPAPSGARDRHPLAETRDPRGGNGAGQAILDAVALARCFAAHDDAVAALNAYEAERLNAANAVVLKSRTAPPDNILKVVHERSGGRPFQNIDDLISTAELAAITDDYKRVAGFDRPSLAKT